MDKDFRSMDFRERVDWAAGYILQQLIAGDFRGGVHLVMSQCAQHPLTEVYTVNDNERVKDAALSPRASRILLGNQLDTAYDVREYIKDYGFAGLKWFTGCGTQTATEIKDYYLGKG